MSESRESLDNMDQLVYQLDELIKANKTNKSNRNVTPLKIVVENEELDSTAIDTDNYLETDMDTDDKDDQDQDKLSDREIKKSFGKTLLDIDHLEPVSVDEESSSSAGGLVEPTDGVEWTEEEYKTARGLDTSSSNVSMRSSTEELNQSDLEKKESNEGILDEVDKSEVPSIHHPNELKRGVVNWFTEHPNKAQQTYFEHMCDAIKFSSITLSCSFCFFVHAFFPFMFEWNGSDWTIELADYLKDKRSKAGL
tara:strand:+ start:127 stop:882 length:756 start_codon:yes stop_codon:yes gene_type:complete